MQRARKGGTGGLSVFCFGDSSGSLAVPVNETQGLAASLVLVHVTWHATQNWQNRLPCLCDCVSHCKDVSTKALVLTSVLSCAGWRMVAWPCQLLSHSSAVEPTALQW
jgi:hypothetical protein